MKCIVCVLACLLLLTLQTDASPRRGERRRGSEEFENGGENGGDLISREGDGKFSLQAHPFYKWPGGILYYEFDSGLDSARRSTSLQAMANVKAALTDSDGNVCIDFQERDPNYASYVLIEGKSGCASAVGRWPGASPMYISSSCSVGNMMHEMLHALGVFHEQSRNDRDDWITVNYQNIRSGAENNFAVSGVYGTELDTHYDYGSIMHYSAASFSSNGEDTITTLDATADIGQRSALTACDIERVQVHYGCKAKVTDCHVDDLSPP